ncbi:hypothetical protein ACQYWQ_18250 [Streptomyces sp. P6-2-1]
MTAGGEGNSFPLAENTWNPVGESADPENRDVPLAGTRTFP